MPKEIKILLPDSSPKEVIDIRIRSTSKEHNLNYRYEIWDLIKDNPNSLTAADFLRQRIKAYEDNWSVVEVFAEENKKIPILLKQNQKKT